jgi:RNA polymerase sigma-70 factor (ECF subfamily)
MAEISQSVEATVGSGRPEWAAGEQTSTSLVRRLQSQDADAWRRLVDLYSPVVYSWCRRCGMQAEDAADVLQEVFRSVLCAVSEFDHHRPGCTFRGWLRVIARNKVRDHFRRQGHDAAAVGGSDAYQRLVNLSAEESEAEASQPPLSPLFRRTLDLIRGEFEERTWAAFWEATVQQRPVAEIAQELAVTPCAVRQAKSRVLRRLRQELGDLE